MEIPFSKSMLVALYLWVVNAEEASGTHLRTRRVHGTAVNVGRKLLRRLRELTWSSDSLETVLLRSPETWFLVLTDVQSCWINK